MTSNAEKKVLAGLGLASAMIAGITVVYHGLERLDGSLFERAET